VNQGYLRSPALAFCDIPHHLSTVSREIQPPLGVFVISPNQPNIDDRMIDAKR
jgi:hypothetical protein